MTDLARENWHGRCLYHCTPRRSARLAAIGAIFLRCRVGEHIFTCFARPPDQGDEQADGDLRRRPGVDEDEQARERQAPEALEDDEQIAARFVFCEQEVQVPDRRVPVAYLHLALLQLFLGQRRLRVDVGEHGSHDAANRADRPRARLRNRREASNPGPSLAL